MIKNYILILFISIATFINGQETINISGYDGSLIIATATTSTVNDEITIVFEDTDIINNFYTEGRTSLFVYGGLDTSSGGFQSAPGFFDNANQPVATLVASDTDANAGPNTYSLTINLSLVYSGVADGTMVFGYNLIFRNEFSAPGDNGNNQTVDLFIDLVDAMKNSTLSIDEVALANDSFSVFPNPAVNQWTISSSSNIESIQVFDLLGKKVIDVTPNAQSFEIDATDLRTGVYLARLSSNTSSKTLKLIKK